MIDTVYKCDVCGAIRGPENHWLLRRKSSVFLLFGPWDDNDTEEEGVQHICGAACGHVVLDRYLESLRGNQ